MKIIDQTRRQGRHTVQLLAETKTDARIVKQIFDAFRNHPETLRAILEQAASDEFPSLRLEESES